MKLEARLKLLEDIKLYHMRACTGIIVFLSIFMFCSGLTFSTINWPMAWWASLLYGWSGMAVALKLSKILDKNE